LNYEQNTDEDLEMFEMVGTILSVR
jgi:hypothetical protein